MKRRLPPMRPVLRWLRDKDGFAWRFVLSEAIGPPRSQERWAPPHRFGPVSPEDAQRKKG